MGDLKERLRDAFEKVRYGEGPYIPDGDLFDVAADRIEALEKALRPLADHADACERLAGHDGPLGEYVPYETLKQARQALGEGQ